MAEEKKVYDLAAELNIGSIELVRKMQEIGIDVKSHMSPVSDSDVQKIKDHLFKKEEKPEKEKKVAVKRKAVEKPVGETTKKVSSDKKPGGLAKIGLANKKLAAEPKPEIKSVQAPAKTIVRRKKTIEEEKAAQVAIEEAAKAAVIAEAAKVAEAEAAKIAKSTKIEPVADDKTVDGKAPAGTVETKIPEQGKEADKGTTTKPHVVTTVTTKEVSARQMEEEDRGKRADKKTKSKVAKKDVKLEVVDVFEVKKQVSTRSQYGIKKKAPTGREQKKTLITKPKASKRKVRITGSTITVADLAKEMSVKAAEIIQKLFAMGNMATINQPIDTETATLIANEFSYELEYVGFDESAFISESEDKQEDLIPRAPVVTMMGHVDHGKTSILDAIRTTHVADKEAGGITQHMGAHEVKLEKGTITFIDTPGHEAFTEMRARGSQITDIVVLVIAADDGVMPQTRESIDHARAAGVDIVVALNKIDKPNANVDMVKKQLADLDLLPEDWGGQTMVIPTAAKKGEGIQKLLESILLQAEIMELKANPNKPGTGIAIEARLDRGMGPVTTVITQDGTLKVGDYVVAGTSYGRIKSIRDTYGKMIDKILPGRAGEILGLDSVPVAGDKFNCVATEYDAKKLVDYRTDEKRKQRSTEGRKSFTTLDEIMKGICAGDTKEMKLVVKADTQGSVEALKPALTNLSDESVAVRVIHASTGGVTSNDVNLAVASGAIVIAFNVRPDVKAQEEAERLKLDIRFYDVIYACLDEMEKAKLCMLEPIDVEKVNGQAEVREVFNVSKIGTIAGCGVKSGKVIRNSQVRVIRDGVVAFTGKIKSLKRFKDDAREVAAGLECGISIDGYNDIKPGDILESFSINKLESSDANFAAASAANKKAKTESLA
ncbi:MAG: translation initiation factor IF-2 [bacterium]